MTGLVRGTIGAVIGGAIGAVIWAAVAYFTHYQLGLIAWLVGLSAGAGMRMGVGSDASPVSGVVAAVVALASIAGGKYAAVTAVVNRELGASERAVRAYANSPGEPEEVQVHIAHELASKAQSDHKTLAWPEGKDLSSAESLEDFPKTIATDAVKQWGALSDADKSARLDAITLEHKEALRKLQEIKSEATSQAFLNSFTVLTIVFAAIALASAYRLGSDVAGS